MKILLILMKIPLIFLFSIVNGIREIDPHYNDRYIYERNKVIENYINQVYDKIYIRLVDRHRYVNSEYEFYLNCIKLEEIHLSDTNNCITLDGKHVDGHEEWKRLYPNNIFKIYDLRIDKLIEKIIKKIIKKFNNLKIKATKTYKKCCYHYKLKW